jgi:para-aminobenzoate synthetase/4-amino-4-deoxychorismate lyase
MAFPAVSLLFDNAARRGGAAILFRHPIGEICARAAGDVQGALAAADNAIACGKVVAGYLAYELGYVLEPRLAPLLPPDHGPLLRLFVFDGAERLDPSVLADEGDGAAEAEAEALGAAFSQTDYLDAFSRALALIQGGDIYQVNLTFPLRFRPPSDAFALYRRLRRRARAGASAFLALGDETHASFSPETFYRSTGGIIRTRPMKGTAPRAPSLAADIDAKRQLRSDPKQRAENLMIVDLLRNDLSRVAKTGTVRVEDLFTVETFPRLHAMTSGIRADLRAGTTFGDIIRALFPCGSITGAPKVRAMEVIRDLESRARGVYCGAIGFAGPGMQAFNVAIRTLSIREGGATFGVGSGVVADSDAGREYEECLLKANFLTTGQSAFAILETLRWEQGRGVALAATHTERLRNGAAYFGHPFEPVAIEATLAAATSRYAGPGPSRVRLTLEESGRIGAQVFPLDGRNGVWRAIVASERLRSGDPFIRHKTTRRSVYDSALAEAARQNAEEAILLNEYGEVADGARSTILVPKNGALLTPPAASGALDGVLRQRLLDGSLSLDGGPDDVTPPIREQVLTLQDLFSAKDIWFANSVRGLVRGEIIRPA